MPFRHRQFSRPSRRSDEGHRMLHVLGRFLLFWLVQSSKNKGSSSSSPFGVWSNPSRLELSKSTGQGPGRRLGPQSIVSTPQRHRVDPLRRHLFSSKNHKSKCPRIKVILYPSPNFKLKIGPRDVYLLPMMLCPSRTSIAYRRRSIGDRSRVYTSATIATRPSSLRSRSSTVGHYLARPTMPSSGKLGYCKSSRTSEETLLQMATRALVLYVSSISSSSLPDFSLSWISWLEPPYSIEF